MTRTQPASVARAVASDVLSPRRLPAAAAGLCVAVVAGAAAALSPLLAVAAAVAAALFVVVMAFPPMGAYVLIATTPLLAGIDRGVVMPLLRPDEGVLIIVVAAVVARSVVRIAAGAPLRARPDSVTVALAVLATTSSVVPLLWMLARGRAVTLDDLLYALVLWKYLALFVVIRTSVRSDDHILACLRLSMATAAIVATVGILQALQLFGVPGLLSVVYAPTSGEDALYIFRGTSTLASSHAVGDVMVFNVVIAVAFMVRGAASRWVMGSAAVLFVFGAVASGQFSAVIGMVVAALALGAVTGHLRRFVGLSVPTLGVAALILWPVIARRLEQFSSPGLLPRSWAVRLENLRTYFWPELFTDYNYVFGVQPSARVPGKEWWQDWVWIESGHTWLLWNGGLPMVAAYIWFTIEGFKAGVRAAVAPQHGRAIAGAAAVAALAVITALMLFDTHLILRGAADLALSLLALSLADVATRSGEDGDRGDAVAVA